MQNWYQNSSTNKGQHHLRFLVADWDAVVLAGLGSGKPSGVLVTL
jgi:hypothetical protein